MLERPSRRPRVRSQRRETITRALLLCVLLALAFLLGIAFAHTLDDRPQAGDVVTNVRSLSPLPQQPPTRTVTVTVTSP